MLTALRLLMSTSGPESEFTSLRVPLTRFSARGPGNTLLSSFTSGFHLTPGDMVSTQQMSRECRRRYQASLEIPQLPSPS